MHIPCKTVLPDEIIIALSEYDRVAPDIITQLEQTKWPFPVTLLLTKQKQFAGENRNTACDHAVADIFICQDADDIPHPQRVEIIRYFFDHYAVEHLLHKWTNVPKTEIPTFPMYTDIENIPFAFHRRFRDLWRCAQFTNGNIALAKHVFHTIRWTSAARAQDSQFNEAVYRVYKHCIAIDAPLLGYRQFLSSARSEIDTPAQATCLGNGSTYQQTYQTTCIYLT